MEHRISHDNMDEILKQLEDDYVDSVRNNNCGTVEGYIEKFLDDSWDYNDRNIDLIKKVMSRYSQGDIQTVSFSGAFNEMVDHLQDKLCELDKKQEYPLIHSSYGGSFLVAFVDGVVIQYYAGVYSVEDFRELTPMFKSVILNAMKTRRE